MSMMLLRRLVLMTLAATLLATAAVAPASDARIPIRVGIGDQDPSMFGQPAFQRAKFQRVRYFVAWNAIDDAGQVARADTFIKTARANGFSVLLHISTDDYTIKKAKLPSIAAYRSKVGALVRRYRALGVREFGTWNEANHASQPTYRSPARAAAFFREMYRLVKPRCSSCAVVALDVLDQTGVERYERSFFRALSAAYRKRATLVGIHNYGDVNRKRTTFTRNVIHMAHRYNKSTRFWFTETGGLVKFGANFKCSTARASSRLKNMFSLARTYRTAGVQRIYIYSWSGPGCDARFDAGLVGPDGTPRPGYTTVRRQLSNYLR
jgi:hypothetical protein